MTTSAMTGRPAVIIRTPTGGLLKMVYAEASVTRPGRTAPELLIIRDRRFQPGSAGKGRGHEHRGIA